MTKTWIDEVESRAEAATPGPWVSPWVQEWNEPNIILVHNIAPTSVYRNSKHDSRFIAASRTDVPRLCKALRMALMQLDNVSVWIEDAEQKKEHWGVFECIRRGDF